MSISGAMFMGSKSPTVIIPPTIPPDPELTHFILYVNTQGNDGTAMANSQDKPFQTLEAALSHALANTQFPYTIVVQPGIYNVASALNPINVPIFLMPGVTLRGENIFECLDGIGVGKYSITGHGRIEATLPLYINVSNPETHCFEFHSIHAEHIAVLCQSGSFRLTAGDIMCGSNTVIQLSGVSYANLRANRIYQLHRATGISDNPVINFEQLIGSVSLDCPLIMGYGRAGAIAINECNQLNLHITAHINYTSEAFPNRSKAAAVYINNNSNCKFTFDTVIETASEIPAYLIKSSFDTNTFIHINGIITATQNVGIACNDYSSQIIVDATIYCPSSNDHPAITIGNYDVDQNAGKLMFTGKIYKAVSHAILVDNGTIFLNNASIFVFDRNMESVTTNNSEVQIVINNTISNGTVHPNIIMNVEPMHVKNLQPYF